MVRGFFRAVIGAAIIVSSLTACGSSDDKSAPDSTPTAPPVVASCTTNEPWSAVPSYLKISMVAVPLGVSEDSVRNGLLGLADCDKPIKMSSIGSGTNPPIVEIKDRGARCLAMGTQEDPRNATTTKIMAVCPSEDTETGKV